MFDPSYVDVVLIDHNARTERANRNGWRRFKPPETGHRHWPEGMPVLLTPFANLNHMAKSMGPALLLRFRRAKSTATPSQLPLD